jgi:hypothetical protein
MSDDDVKGDTKGDSTTDINLSSRGFTQLTEKIIKNFGATAKRLDLTDNEIKSGANFDQMTSLEVLVLDKNNVETFENWPVLRNVTTLWLNNNKISDINAAMDFISKTFPNLAYLSMMKNPACPNMYFSDGEAEAYQRYRYYVIHRLKKLKFLDATPVVPEERKEAEKRGAFLSVARPKSAPKSPEPLVPSTPEEPKKKEVKEHTPKVATFLAKGKARYDGSNSEGNRFIMNDDL